MAELGFKEVYDLRGGILLWEEEELPVTVPRMEQAARAA